MNKDLEKSMRAYVKMMKGTVRDNDYVAAALLIERVKERCYREEKLDTNSEALYMMLLETADELRLENPFTNREEFLMIYRMGMHFEKMDWENLIALTLSAARISNIPEAVVNLYEARLSSDPKTCLIAEAEKFTPNLQSIIDKHKSTKFTLTTQHTSVERALKLLFEGYDNVEVLIANIYELNFLNKRFDLICACPAFGVRALAADRNFMCREQEMVALENLSLHLEGNGRLVIILPGRITFASGKVNDLRQFIQTNYTIKEIDELPEGSLRFTGIKIYMLDIENTRPEDDDVIIRRYSASKKNQMATVEGLEIKDDTFVMMQELQDQGNWSVDRIFAQQDEDYLKFMESTVHKDLLGNVAQVFRGKALTRKDPSGNIGVINIKNIGVYDIDYDELDYIEEEDRKVMNYLLQEGDVILPARGTAIRTAVFHEQNNPFIASSNVIVIRPNANYLDSIYLKMFLDSPIGNKIISCAQQGTAVMNISYKDLKDLEIPVPPIAKQKEIAKQYSEELERYRKTVAEAEARWGNVLAKLQKF
jgi:type I restriction enzyme M protein